MNSEDMKVESDDEAIWQQIIRESEECQNRTLFEFLSQSAPMEIRKSRSKHDLDRTASQ